MNSLQIILDAQEKLTGLAENFEQQEDPDFVVETRALQDAFGLTEENWEAMQTTARAVVEPASPYLLQGLILGFALGKAG